MLLLLLLRIVSLLMLLRLHVRLHLLPCLVIVLIPLLHVLCVARLHLLLTSPAHHGRLFRALFLLLNFLVNFGNFQRALLLSAGLPHVLAEGNNLLDGEAHARIESLVLGQSLHAVKVSIEVTRLLRVRLFFKGLSDGCQQLAEQFNVLSPSDVNIF